MRLLAISGSLRRGSHNTELLRAAAALLPPGVELEWFDGLKAVPPYDADDDIEPAPAAVGELRDALAAADAVLISTPEYNHSIPGLLKNALDWASRPFPDNALRDRPVAVIGASTSIFGAVWAQAELRKVLGAIGARVIDHELPVAVAHEAFDEDGRLLAGEHENALTEIVLALVEEARERVARGGVTVRVGIVGVGRMGEEHLKAFALVPDVEVVAVTDHSAERARELAGRHGIESVYKDFEALIDADEVDAVDIATPPSAMPDVVQAACAHGKPIMCEKPLGANARAQARAMWEAATSAGVVHALCHQRRYDPVHRYVRTLVAEGFVGSPLLVAVQVMTDFGRGSALSGWLRESELGGGFFLQVLSHYVDLLRFTFGELEVTEREGDDVVALLGTLAGGAQVSLVGSWSLHHPAGVLWQIYGSEGTINITTEMRILGGHAGEPLADLGLPDEYLPAVGAELFSPYDRRGQMGWGDNTPMLASLAADFAAQVAGTAEAAPIYATFDDGLRFHELVATR